MMSSSTVILSEWISRTIDEVDRTSSSLNAATALAPHLRKSMILCSDDYLLSALRVSRSLADSICKAEEEGDKKSLPIPSFHWADGIAVHNPQQATQNNINGTLLPTTAENGEQENYVRAEFLPVLCNVNDDKAAVNDFKMQRIYSLGIVLYEIFSGGERPIDLLGGEQTTADGGSNNTLSAGEENLNLDLLVNDQALPIDLGNDIDDLLDRFTEDELNIPKKRQSQLGSNSANMRSSVSLETLRSKWIPGTLCDLISNMLDSTSSTNHALEGDDSYKSMGDVRDDLTLMLEKPEIFLYDQDMSKLSVTGLQFRDTVFGRNVELSTIKEAYRRSLMGSRRDLVVISGPSGSGKSLLASELGKYVSAGGGIVLSGKFDQLQQGKPFSALASAFDIYCDHLMKAGGCLSSHLDVLTSELIASLGGEVYYLAKMIPNLALILGSNVFDTSHDQVCDHPQERLEYLLCKFVEAISTSSGAPVTLFLDDLQWADAASMAAVSQLLFSSDFSTSSIKKNKQFFFYGCCREGAIDKEHPVWKLFCRAKLLGVNYVNVSLECFNEETLNTMVSETLHLSPRLTRSLSSIIHHKTKGNPLFVSQLMISLNKEGLLRPSLSRRRWEWDREKIESQKLPDNVANFITSSIQSLPEDVKTSLSVLSCFGASVKSSVLKKLERALNKIVVDNLDVAVREGLLDKADDQYRFSHDRIQEAAYNNMKFEDRCHFHFFYGMALAPPEGGSDDSTLLIAANQIYLAGPEAVKDKSQNVIIANLNLRAGKKAMEMSDFVAAYSYFDSGISFLRKKLWDEHYALSLDLYDLAAKCALINGDTVTLQVLYEQVLKYGRTFEDKLNVMYFSTCALAFSSRLRESIEIGLDILSKLGIDLRREKSSMEVCVRETKELLSNFSDDDILNTRRMTDPTMIIAMKFLGKMLAGMTQIMPKFVARVTQRIIQLSLIHGMSPVSPVGFVHFGSYVAKFGDISGGYHYVKLARSLLDKVGSKESAGEVISFGTQVVAYVEPVQAALEHHHEGYTAAMASGDVLQAGVNRVLFSNNYIFTGVNLQTACEKIAESIQFCEDRKQMIFLIQMQYSQHSMLKLIGTDEEPKYTAEGQDILSSNNSVMTTYYFQKVFVGFLFRSYDGTNDNIGKYLASIVNTWANLFIFHAFHGFYIGLVSFWLARKSGSGSVEGQQWNERGKLSKMTLKKWAESSSWNFENKWYLLEAEESFCSNNFVEAKTYYDKAIASAKDHKFVNEEALACELAAYFYLELGQKDKALELFLAAHEKYHEWGAFGKCTSLFEFVSTTFTSFIRPGQTLTNTSVNIGQETAAPAAAPVGDGGLFSLMNTNANVAQKAVSPTAAPNVDGSLLTSLDDVLQRYAAS